MSRSFLRAVVGLVVLAFAALLQPGSAFSQGIAPRGLYRGQVLEGRGQKPVPGALVLFTDKNSGVAYSAFSDDLGKYEIHVPRGTYTLLMMIEDKTFEPEEASRQTAEGAWALTFAPATKGSISDQEVSLTSDKQEIVVRPKEDRARGARKTLVLEVVSPPPPNVAIHNIRTSPDKEVHPRELLEVTVEGTRNGTATVSVGNAVTGRPLEEVKGSPGTYRGRVEIPQEYEGVYLVSATIATDEAGETTLNGPQIQVAPQAPPTPVVAQPMEQPPQVEAARQVQAEAPQPSAVAPAEVAPPAEPPQQAIPTPQPEAPPARVPETRAAEAAPTPAIDPVAITAALGMPHFEFNSDDIRDDAGALLTQAAMLLEQKRVLGAPNLWLIVEGHCDEVGSDDYNDRLGQQRAEAVRNLLVSEGLPSDRIKTASYGRRCPVQRLGTAADQNRRVKLRVASLGEAAAARPIDTSTCP